MDAVGRHSDALPPLPSGLNFSLISVYRGARAGDGRNGGVLA
jgi:hypothetical protein